MFTKSQHCIIIGASHAGVQAAFSLRKEGWEGKISLFDSSSFLPYHRPPLSKSFLCENHPHEKYQLKSKAAYEKADIDLQLGISILSVQRKQKVVISREGKTYPYDKLILALGGSPIIPPIPGIDSSNKVFPLRTLEDVQQIKEALHATQSKRVAIVGGGYIGLETAASLRKLGARVTVLEREERVLARVTCNEMSYFFQQLHTSHGVQILTQKEVVHIQDHPSKVALYCSDGSTFTSDICILGVGISPNTSLANEASLEIKNGVLADSTGKTSDPDIYAIGDCSNHFHEGYQTHLRLESVQNAVDQAKVAAANICGKEITYDSIPWFWSDQYSIKLQIAGLSTGYTEVICRKSSDTSFSFWYFRNDTLLAVDAINDAKAYVNGMKWLKGRIQLDKEKIANDKEELKLAAVE
ncbi:MAG: FAD-dependent oxidoreductase [Bacteroidota bacterium]